MERLSSAENNELIIGRNAVLEAIRSGRNVDHLLITKGERSGSVGKITALCREKNIPVKEVDSRKLDSLAEGHVHQGVIALAACHNYSDLSDILAFAEEKKQPPFIIICDEIEDPHNLGAIIRSAEAAGAHGIIIPKRRSAGLTFAVAKAASGALEYMRIARVPNLASTIDGLKEKGIWIYGADMDGQDAFRTNFSGAVALVIGSEGSGLGRLIKEKCDFIVSLPMNGRINSLNASVAGGILMYEILRGRGKE